MEKPEGYPEIIITSPRMFLEGEVNDMSFEFGDHDYYYSLDDLKSGKLLSDTKVMAVIEFLRDIFLRRKELLPQLQDQIIEAVKEKGIRFWRVKSDNSRTRVVTMARSLSLGSPRRNERFKIKTINTAGGTPVGGGGGGGPK